MSQRIYDKKRALVTTNNATPVVINIAIPTGSTAGFIAKITIRNTTTNVGGFIHQVGVISNNAGATALDGVNISLASILNAGILTATGVITASGSNLVLTLTGIVATNLEWLYEIEMINT